MTIGILTSQMSALLQMVHALAVIAFTHLLPDQPRHHALHPLLSDDRVLRRFQGLVVIVVDAVEGGWDGGFGGFERSGLGGRHCRERRIRSFERSV